MVVVLGPKEKSAAKDLVMTDGIRLNLVCADLAGSIIHTGDVSGLKMSVGTVNYVKLY